MSHPFQCVAIFRSRYFVAACGPTLTSLDLETGEVLCEWAPDQAAATTTTQSNGKTEDHGQPPAKKQKTASPPKASSVIKLAVSPDQGHLVVVTEDKCVHVFEHNEGQLLEISQRIMPKRPCAVDVLPDNATILVADKFGDVYSIPLIPTAADSGDANAGAEDATPQAEPHFKPSADFTTIHSKRNRQALEAQMKQKNFTKKKEPLKFEHKILIGHVSMLTDMHYMREESSPERGYIVTADRDEHVRVSRGPPQSHIIEGFCLGHTEFISKICQVGNSSLLVSGGGDDWLGVWDWPNFKLRQKLDVKRLLPGSPEKIAVSGIWNTSIEAGNTSEPAIVVAVDKVKALIVIPRRTLEMTEDEYASKKEPSALTETLSCDGYPLDFVSLQAGKFWGPKAVVSLDTRGTSNKYRLQTFSMCQSVGGQVPTIDAAWEHDGVQSELNLDALNSSALVEVKDKELDALLDGVANLRKRRDVANGEVDGDEQHESILSSEAGAE